MSRSEPFSLRYAPHISFYGRALFDELAGTSDPIAQINFVADHGFAGVQDPLLGSRPLAEQSAMGEALAKRNVQMGTFGFRIPGRENSANWADPDPDNCLALKTGLAYAIDVAKRTGGRHISITTSGIDRVPKWLQLLTVAENLRAVADDAAKAGVELVVEGLDVNRVPQMLLRGLADSYQVVRTANHPAIRLIFDTGHIQAMDGNLFHHLDQVWKHVAVVQIADCPGRVEPGSGEINFARFFEQLIRRDYRGLCELEHLWTRPGAAYQRYGIEALRELDRKACREASKNREPEHKDP